MRVVNIIVLGIVGFALGLGLWKISESGYFEEWQELSTPPQNVTELIPTGAPPFFIKTSDSSTYYYEHGEGWLLMEIPQDIRAHFDVIKPCNHLSPEFFPFSNPPSSIIDCFQETTTDIDGYMQYAVVLDSNGNFWEWKHAVTPDYVITLFCFPSVGLLLGLSTAFLLRSQNGNQAKHKGSAPENAG